MRNPVHGTIIATSPGQPVEVTFSIMNEAPDPAPFTLEVTGLSSDWITGAGTRKNIASGATSTLKLTINPAATAQTADYPFRVRTVSRNTLVDPPGECTLVLRVTGGQSPGVNGSSAPPIVEPAAESDIASFAVVSTPTVAPSPPPPAQPDTARPIETNPPAPTPLAAVAPITPGPPPVPAPAVPTQSGLPWSEAGPAPTPPVAANPPRPTPQEAPLSPPPARAAAPPVPPSTQPVPPPRPVPAPEARPASRDTAHVLQAFQEAQAARQAADEAADQVPVAPEDDQGPMVSDEPFLLDPRPGESLTLRPGTTGLVRFSFTNRTPATTAYDLSDDRRFTTDWITLIRPTVTITANGTKEVVARLTPPLDAEPGNYPFVLSVGPRGGAPTPCPLNLYVLPTPSVRLITQKGSNPTVRVGLLAREAVFNLAVESQGNTDTAFRIAVKAPEVEDSDPNAARGPEDIDETPPWRYLFDKELETLETKIQGQPPPPQPIHLYVRRVGIWWFGFRERHTMKVAAAPVTDPANGGKTDNALELTAIRNRLPFVMHPPLQIMLLLLLFFLLTSDASDLTVTNGYLGGGTYYVFGQEKDKPVPVHLKWNAPFYALLSLSATTDGRQPPQNEGYPHGKFADSVAPDSGKFAVEKSYELRGANRLTVRCLPFVDKGWLRLFVNEVEQLQDATAVQETVGQGTDQVTVSARSLPAQGAQLVPSNKYLTLQLENASPATGEGGHTIVWYLVDPPDTRIFDVPDAKIEGNIPPGQYESVYKIKYKGGGDPNKTYTLTFVTTDGDCQILHVNLKVQ